MTSCALEGVVSTFRLSQLKIIPILFAEAAVEDICGALTSALT